MDNLNRFVSPFAFGSVFHDWTGSDALLGRNLHWRSAKRILPQWRSTVQSICTFHHERQPMHWSRGLFDFLRKRKLFSSDQNIFFPPWPQKRQMGERDVEASKMRGLIRRKWGGKRLQGDSSSIKPPLVSPNPERRKETRGLIHSEGDLLFESVNIHPIPKCKPLGEQ